MSWPEILHLARTEALRERETARHCDWIAGKEMNMDKSRSSRSRDAGPKQDPFSLTARALGLLLRGRVHFHGDVESIRLADRGEEFAAFRKVTVDSQGHRPVRPGAAFQVRFKCFECMPCFSTRKVRESSTITLFKPITAIETIVIRI